MAKEILTRIGLKIDTLAKWNESNIGLYAGELAIATVAAGEGHGLSEPVIMIKIGEDGVKTFKELPWALHAKASDVYEWAKQSETEFVANFFGMKNAEGNTLEQILDSKFATNGELATDVATLRGEITALGTTLRGELTTALASYYTKTEIDDMIGDLDVGAMEGRIDDLETAVGTTLPGQINAVDAKFADYTKTADLPTDLGDFTNEAGYAKAADVYSKTEADGKFLTEHQSLADYYTKGQIDTALEGKQDVIPTNTYDAYGSAAAVAEDLAEYVEAHKNDYTNGVIDEKVGAVNTALETYKGEVTTALNGKQDVIPENTYDAYGSAAAVEAKLADYTKTADLPKDLGDLTNNAGYALLSEVPTDAEIRAAAADEINTLIGAADDEGGETIQKIADLVDYVEKNAGEIAQLVTDVNTANTNASNAVTTAGEAKTAAEGAATVAGEAKTTAAEALEAATNATTGAAASANAAAASAAEALASQNAAAQSVIDAGVAKDAAVVAQGAAEDAQEAAEAAQGAAEGARDAAQAAQGLAEGARDAAAQHKADAEAAKGATETAQGLAEDAKDAAVVAQGAAEDARDLAAGYKADAETAKGAAETAQTKAEAAQAKAEEAQAAAEQAKADAEASNTSATAIANEAKTLAGTAASDAAQAKKDAADALDKVGKLTTDDIDGGTEVWVFKCGTASTVI